MLKSVKDYLDAHLGNSHRKSALLLAGLVTLGSVAGCSNEKEPVKDDSRVNSEILSTDSSVADNSDLYTTDTSDNSEEISTAESIDNSSVESNDNSSAESIDNSTESVDNSTESVDSSIEIIDTSTTESSEESSSEESSNTPSSEITAQSVLDYCNNIAKESFFYEACMINGLTPEQGEQYRDSYSIKFLGITNSTEAGGEIPCYYQDFDGLFSAQLPLNKSIYFNSPLYIMMMNYKITFNNQTFDNAACKVAVPVEEFDNLMKSFDINKYEFTKEDLIKYSNPNYDSIFLRGIVGQQVYEDTPITPEDIANANQEQLNALKNALDIVDQLNFKGEIPEKYQDQAPEIENMER